MDSGVKNASSISFAPEHPESRVVSLSDRRRRKERTSLTCFSPSRDRQIEGVEQGLQGTHPVDPPNDSRVPGSVACTGSTRVHRCDCRLDLGNEMHRTTESRRTCVTCDGKLTLIFFEGFAGPG